MIINKEFILHYKLVCDEVDELGYKLFGAIADYNNIVRLHISFIEKELKKGLYKSESGSIVYNFDDIIQVLNKELLSESVYNRIQNYYVHDDLDECYEGLLLSLIDCKQDEILNFKPCNKEIYDIESLIIEKLFSYTSERPKTDEERDTLIEFIKELIMSYRFKKQMDEVRNEQSTNQS